MPRDTSQPEVLDVMDLVRLGERATAVLADLREVNPVDGGGWGTHFTDCWHLHAGCLAARIRATLTGEDHPQ